MDPSRAPKSEKPKKFRTRPHDRRTFTPGVDRLERRVSLSGVGLTASVTHGAGLVEPDGTTLNHNETLVRAPRRRRR
jgi:hypothetical protein